MIDFNSSGSVSGQLEALVDAGMQRQRAKQMPRAYLGASRLGASCERALQYEFAKAPVDPGRDTSGRILRIFERGHVMEDCMVMWLREASDRWLIPHLPQMEVELELGSNEAVKRAVASGVGLGCLSRYAVKEAIDQGWLVEVFTSLPAVQRTLAIVLHRSKRLGAAAAGFLQHCVHS